MTSTQTHSGERKPGEHPLNPKLPFDIKPRIKAAVADTHLRQSVKTATESKDRNRADAFRETFGPRYDQMRDLAGRIKQHTLDHLDVYLERFVDQATEAGVQVHYAADAEQANAICTAIARDNGCTRCVKSKSMVTEETRLVPALEAIGVETIETDLGEFILQLDGDAPSHIVTPMIHKDRRSVARAFQRELGAPYTEDPEQLTMIAREYLRQKYRQADLGISGANFLIAQTGTIVICTNEGNAGFTVHGPRIHIALAGIEKIIPKRSHLSVFLKLLARSSTSQPLTVYTTFITGPRREGEHDGPEQVHLILVDNGRTEILARSTRELLRCIRCGACLNTCPVFCTVGGGHAYGAIYSGPIGSAITPLFKGLENYPDLPHVCSLCGACAAVCPVKIDLPRHLIRLRREMVTDRITSRRDRLGYRAWATLLKRLPLYLVITTIQRYLFRALGKTGAKRGGFNDRRWIANLPGKVGGWTRERDLPTPTSSGFRTWWKTHHKKRMQPRR
ncbi:MAG: iron-sulfur cluster-binding protein [Phycisphaerales bacterium]|nr:iron-sulfur cluster-binding protein [Phycisphaerales bacterium]